MDFEKKRFIFLFVSNPTFFTQTHRLFAIGKTFGTSAKDDHFPLMVLGLIDMSHRYFPVAFMYPSLEQNDSYTHLLKSIVKLLRTFGFAFNLK